MSTQSAGGSAGEPAGTADLRVAVLGVGIMGADHLRRLATVTAGARPVVVADAFVDKAREAAAGHPGVRVVEDPFAAIADPEVDAVLVATPGFTHEELVLACLEAGKPVLCEKPLTTQAETSLAIVRAEQSLLGAGRQLVQVGFMRRFDAEYAALRELIASGDLGQPLMLHCAHRNASVPPGFDTAMVIKDSLVHEIDVARFLLGEEVVAITMRYPRTTTAAPAGLSDPALAILETASGRLVDVELFVTTGLGYEVRTEVVAERGTALIGLDRGLLTHTGAVGRGRRVPPDYRERFAAAYDTEVQRWVRAAARGTIDGPGAWDGYAATAVVEAGLASLASGGRATVELAPRMG